MTAWMGFFSHHEQHLIHTLLMSTDSHLHVLSNTTSLTAPLLSFGTVLVELPNSVLKTVSLHHGASKGLATGLTHRMQPLQGTIMNQISQKEKRERERERERESSLSQLGLSSSCSHSPPVLSRFGVVGTPTLQFL